MAKSKGESGIGFLPYEGYIALAAPKEFYPPKDVILTEAAAKAHMENKAQECINGKLKVAAVGSACKGVMNREYFVQPGDVVLLSSHIRPQAVEIDVKGLDTPLTYWIVRDSDILVKFD